MNISCTSSLLIVEAVRSPLRWLEPQNFQTGTYGMILAGAMNLIERIKPGSDSPDWYKAMTNLDILKVLCMHILFTKKVYAR